MKLIKRLTSHYWLFLILYTVLLFFALIPYYRGGHLLLGQEGNNFIDFSIYLHNFRFPWQTGAGTGFFHTSVNAVFPNIYLLVFWQNLINHPQAVNFLLVFSMYFLPFLGIFLLGRKLRLSPLIAFLVSLFYIVNPFTLYYLFSNLNHWSVLTLFALPLFFLVILKFYEDNLKLFVYFGLTSLMLAFVNVNPPLMVIIQIAIFISTIIVSSYRHRNVSFFLILKKYLVVLSSFFLFNFWWIINWFYLFTEIQKDYTKQFAISWLRGTGQFIPALWRTLTLTNLLSYPLDLGENSLVRHYSHFYSPVILSLPVVIIFSFLLRKRPKEKHYFIIGLMMLMVGFLAKGAKGLLGGIYEFLVMNLPLFSVLKTAPEKWGVLFVFLMTLLLIFIFRELKKKSLSPPILGLFLIYLFYTAIPLMSSDFLPDSRANEEVISSKRFVDKNEYQDLKKELNADPLQYRVLAFPGSSNYQVALQIEGDKFYTGYDPILNNINKAFITPYTGTFSQRFRVLFDAVSTPSYLDFFGLFNIKKIMINKDIYPWFGFREKENLEEIEKVLDKSLQSVKNEVIDLYDLGDYYLPRFYVPKELIYVSSYEESDFPPLLEKTNGVSQRSAFFFPSEEEEKNDFLREKASGAVVVGENQSAIDEVNLRNGVRGLNPEGVFFPYARWKPGSFLYPLIQKKEERTKEAFAGNPRLLFDQNLFFAAKRIYEIQKWEPELDGEQFRQVLEQYQQEMSSAVELLDQLATQKEDTFMMLAQIEVAYEAHQKRLLDVLSGNYGEVSNERVSLAKSALAWVDAGLKRVVERHFFYPKYFFEVPKDGEYELLVESKGLSADWEIKRIGEGEEKETIGRPGLLPQKGDWVSFGKQQFSRGDLYLELTQPPPQDLATEDWLGDKFSQSGGKISLLADKALVYQEIKDLKPETVYHVSFDYKTVDGKLGFALEEKKKVDSRWLERGAEVPFKKSIEVLNLKLDSEGEWQPFQTTLRTDKNSNAVKILITSLAGPEKTPQIEYQNFKFEVVVEPKMILREIRETNDFQIPQITFQKINATRYLVEVKNATDPYFLVFSESFHRGWKAYVSQGENNEGEILASYFGGAIKEKRQKDLFLDKEIFRDWGQEPLPEDRHFAINGYANAWYLTPADAGGQKSYQIVIEYWPIRLFWLGIFVTAATIFSVLVISLIRFRRKKKEDG